MLDSLVEFLTLLKDFVVNFVDGLWNFINAVLTVARLLSPENLLYFPTAIMTVCGVSIVLLIVLRIVGR